MDGIGIESKAGFGFFSPWEPRVFLFPSFRQDAKRPLCHDAGVFHTLGANGSNFTHLLVGIVSNFPLGMGDWDMDIFC